MSPRLTFSPILSEAASRDPTTDAAKRPQFQRIDGVGPCGPSFAEGETQVREADTSTGGPYMATSATAGLRLAETTTSSNTSELRRLSTFLEISQTLAGGSNQKTALHQVLSILGRHHSAVRSTVALVNATDEIEVVAAEGPPGGKTNAK